MSKSRKTLTLDDEVFVQFEEICEANNLTIHQAVTALMHSLIDGDIMVAGKKIISLNAVEHVSRENEPRNKVGRPEGSVNKEPKPKSKTHDAKGRLIPWYEQDHSDRAIWDYKMYPEPHIAADPRVHLTFETRGDITGDTFEDHIRHDYLREACNFTEREWQGKLWEFISCVALKFFTLNKMQNIRYDPDTLFAEVNTLYDEMQEDIASCKAYEQEQKNAAK